MTEACPNISERRAWERRGCALGLSAAIATFGAGCGDGPICPGEVLVVITSPAEGVEIGPGDDVSDEPGLQIDVRARSNLGEGEPVELVVRDAGGAVATFTAVLDGEGKATFRDVAIPAGDVQLEAQARSLACGVGTDRIAASGTNGAACELAIREGPIPSEVYDPLPVLNASNDGDKDLPGFQATVDISTRRSYEVELFVLDVGAGEEASAGREVAATNGVARFDLTLGQGPQALRALCRSRSGGTVTSSTARPVFVDTEPPSCQLAHPPDGLAIIPELDENSSLDGTQVTLVGDADDEDVDAGSATFRVGGQALAGTAIDAGTSTVVATFAAPGRVGVAFSVADLAGNACEASRLVEYVTEGCAIAHEAPVDVVVDDANTSLPGVQVELAVDVDPACEGNTVTTSCDVTGEASAQAVADDLTTMEITVCEDDDCETSYDCETQVVSDAGITTFAPATIVVDTAPPPVALEFIDPDDLSCGEVVDDSVDVDPDPGGVQIDVRSVSPGADTRHVIVTSDGDDLVYEADPDGHARIELFEGENEIVAVAADEHGNEAQSDACSIELAD